MAQAGRLVPASETTQGACRPDPSVDVVDSCTVPSLPTGTFPLTAQQDSGVIDVSLGTFTII
jgi:hypothetical protein